MKGGWHSSYYDHDLITKSNKKLRVCEPVSVKPKFKNDSISLNFEVKFVIKFINESLSFTALMIVTLIAVN